MPRTLGLVDPSRDYRNDIIRWLHDSGEDTLFIKPVCGGAGKGIVLAKKIGQNIYIQSKTGRIPLDGFSLSEIAIVQEALRQDGRMSAFSQASVNTIRVVTMLTKDGSTIILGATMRCGVGPSFVDNWSAGGVAVGIDIESGRLKKFAFDKEGHKYTEHPTTRTLFENFPIPEWKAIIDIAHRIQRIFPWYRLLGLDIALQENAIPTLIEVNDSTDLLFQEQTSGPLLLRSPVLRAFGQYDLLINKHQKKLYAALSKATDERRPAD